MTIQTKAPPGKAVLMLPCIVVLNLFQDPPFNPRVITDEK